MTADQAIERLSIMEREECSDPAGRPLCGPETREALKLGRLAIEAMRWLCEDDGGLDAGLLEELPTMFKPPYFAFFRATLPGVGDAP